MELLTKTLLENNNFRNNQNYILKKNFIKLSKYFFSEPENIYKVLSITYMVMFILIPLIVILKSLGFFINGFTFPYVLGLVIVLVSIICFIYFYNKINKANILRLSVHNNFLGKKIKKVYGTKNYYQLID